MTNEERQALLDRAVALLRLTTVGYAGHSAAWQANKTTKWWQALDLIRQAREGLNPPVPPPSSGYGQKVGASTHMIWHPGVEAKCRDLRQRGGITWIREDIHWSTVQPNKNSPLNWALADKLIDGAKRGGLSGVLGILDSPPGWVWTDADYASVCAQFADRYRAVGIEVAIEFWNEPYMPGPYLEPGRYARMCKAAGQAVKNAAPNMKRMANVDTGDYKTGAQDPNGYFDGMIAAVPDLRLYLDAWSLHPYNGIHHPASTTNTDGQRWRFDRVPYFQTLAARKNATLPIWITEYGWSTCSNRSECVTERQQAAFVAAGAKLAIDEWKVGRVFVYMGDRDGGDDKEGRFGMYRQADGAPKPVLAALSSLS